MEDLIKNYWHTRLINLKEKLEANNFEVFLAENAAQA